MKAKHDDWKNKKRKDWKASGSYYGKVTKLHNRSKRTPTGAE
jgi:hypothetical protein